MQEMDGGTFLKIFSLNQAEIKRAKSFYTIWTNNDGDLSRSLGITLKNKFG